ncbi:MAG: DUF4231 domain-containing protein [Halieaceae bacterium]|nr:DUF4231 domain-containing protein [Halieaceae bacterium]
MLQQQRVSWLVFIALTIVLLLASVASAAERPACHERLIPAAIETGENRALADYLVALRGTVLFAASETEGSYCSLTAWYEEKMFARRFSSRMLAVLIIVLGASLPVVAILDRTFTNQKFWVAFIGAAIVIGQGFAQTFQYEESWRNYTIAKLELESAHRSWQKAIVDATTESDGLERAKLATDVFADTVSRVVLKETTGFFDTTADAMRALGDQPKDK